MELQKQVCSLELAKRLKELGVKQESYFCWFQNARSGNWMIGDAYDAIKNGEYKDTKDGKEEIISYSAFTVAELGKMLPNKLRGEDGVVAYRPYTYLSSEGWRCEYWSGTFGRPQYRKGGDCYAVTEADARAKMLIYLHEHHGHLIGKYPDSFTSEEQEKTNE
jgi:hypothetical protein